MFKPLHIFILALFLFVGRGVSVLGAAAYQMAVAANMGDSVMRANLVNHLTFDDVGGEGNVNLLKAAVGADAIAYRMADSTGGAVPVAGLGGLSVCADIAALDGLAEGSHAIAIPRGHFLGFAHAIVKAGNAPWCLKIRCYAPSSDLGDYVSFYSLVQDNRQNAALFCAPFRNYKIGSSKWNGGDSGYDGLFASDAWHDLIVSFDGTTASVYVDTMDNPVVSRATGHELDDSLDGKNFFYIGGNNTQGHDRLLYVDELWLYDQARPSELFHSKNLVNHLMFDDIGGEGNVNLLKATVGADAVAYRMVDTTGGVVRIEREVSCFPVLAFGRGQ